MRTAPLLLVVLAMTTGCAATWFPPPAALLSPGCPEAVHLPRPSLSITTAYLDSGVVCVDSIAPVYPEIAREASVDGTVLLDVLVCEHGRVTETAFRKSIPMLDAGGPRSRDRPPLPAGVRARARGAVLDLGRDRFPAALGNEETISCTEP